MANAKILLVEDDEALQFAIRETLGSLWQISWAANLAEAERKLLAENFNLVLLDVNLPDGTGFQFCEKIRQQEQFRSLPIIFLTGQGDIDDRVRGFEIGGDDYILKPFERKEFIARIQGKLSRAAKPSSFVKGDFKVDLKAMKAHQTTDGVTAELNLTPNEFKLLVHFLEHEGQVFSRDALLKALWGEAVHVSTHTIDTHISSLRKKLGKSGASIRAVVKQGYCFSPTSTLP